MINAMINDECDDYQKKVEDAVSYWAVDKWGMQHFWRDSSQQIIITIIVDSSVFIFIIIIKTVIVNCHHRRRDQTLLPAFLMIWRERRGNLQLCLFWWSFAGRPIPFNQCPEEVQPWLRRNDHQEDLWFSAWWNNWWTDNVTKWFVNFHAVLFCLEYINRNMVRLA